MRPVVKIVLPLVVVMGAVAAAVAVAEPITPTVPYPAPAANAPACDAKRLAVREAQADYDYAKKMYDLEKEAFDRGVGSPADLWFAERDLQVAGIALNDAKYAEVICRNDKGNAANKVCVDLALKLNKLVDELPMRIVLQNGAKEQLDRVTRTAGTGVEGRKALAAAQRDAEKSKAARERIEQEIKDLRDAIKNNPACAGFDPERPKPNPPAPPAPPVSSAPPTQTTEPTATSTPPTGISTGSPAPGEPISGRISETVTP